MLGWRQGLSQYWGARGQPGARSQEPVARGQEPGARIQEPGDKSQETRCHLLQSAMSVQGMGKALNRETN